jgi:phage terminase large subunit GpA-like protein
MKQIDELSKYFDFSVSREKPSDWAEKNRYLPSEVSKYPGKYDKHLFPFWIEPLDKMSPDDPTHIVTIRGGAQGGKTMNFIENAIGFWIANHPANIILTSADEGMSKTVMSQRIDSLIANSGISYLIRPNTLKKKNLKTGDTDRQKEFPGGFLSAQSIKAVDKIRQNSFCYGLFDDFEASVRSQKQAGDVLDLLLMRFNAYSDKMKVAFISTPELKANSVIDPAFDRGDQRYYYMPCPVCGELITFEWQIELDEGKFMAGVTFEKDEKNHLIKDTVGYICPKCRQFFNEIHKRKMLNAGSWIPTAIPSREDWCSYQMSNLYSPPGFFSWSHYASQWLEIYPQSGIVHESKKQVFYNLVLGKSHEPDNIQLSANLISRNIKNYEIGTVPNKISIEDGNEDIIILTMACDLNGFEDDARLDYEITAHSLTGSTYSIDHGSIGTFQRGLPREGRELFSYYREAANSVWHKVDEMLLKDYKIDSGGTLRIAIAGIDTGFFTQLAYAYIDSHQSNVLVVGLKGDPDEKKRNVGADTPIIKESRERIDIYMVQTNQIKDMLSEFMKLKQQERQPQPSNFMNYPLGSEGKYDYRYFDQYESEVRKPVLSDNGSELAYIWTKKTSHSKNHFWDCRVYNLALRDILVKRLGQALKTKITWVELCRYLKK